jgi:hypothetical protein
LDRRVIVVVYSMDIMITCGLSEANIHAR